MKNRKALKSEYKAKKFPMGVFLIKNNINGKILLDSSLNMPAKWSRHQMELKFGSHRNKALQQEWKQFGAENFVMEIVSEIPLKEETIDYDLEVKTLKQLYLEEWMPYGEKGYHKK